MYNISIYYIYIYIYIYIGRERKLFINFKLLITYHTIYIFINYYSIVPKILRHKNITLPMHAT